MVSLALSGEQQAMIDTVSGALADRGARSAAAVLQDLGIEALVGAKAADALFPVNAPIQEPIEPVPGRDKPRWVATSFPAPVAPDARAVASAMRRDATVRR